MIEALWSVEFIADTGFAGAGVVIFESGGLFGGDSGYFYLGSYRIHEGLLGAKIVIQHYSGPFNSVFGPIPKFTVSLAGHVDQETFELIGESQEFPGKILCRLTRRAELP